MAKNIYKYKYRPECNTENFLIEFLTGTGNTDFMPVLLNALAKINPEIVGIEDLWMNDEILLELKSNIGEFILSKDTWGFAFIMSKENQDGLKRIDSILSSDKRFEKVEVD